MASNVKDLMDLDIFVNEDKYNSDLNVDNLFIQYNHINFPRSQYIYLHDNSLPIKNVFDILTLNIRSIPMNLQSFVDNILCNLNIKHSIIGLTEIRLSSHLASLYQLPGYKMFSNCRNTHGGGVAVYISDSYHATIVDKFSNLESFIESIGIHCTIMNKKALILCIYRPPSGNMEIFFKVVTEMLCVAHDDKYQDIFLLGDFNIDLVRINDNVREFCNLMFSFSLFPLTTKPTRITDTTATLIDHIWTTLPDLNIGNYIINADISDHFPVLSQFKLIIDNSPAYVKKRIINDSTLNNFQADLEQIDWTSVLQCTCPNKSFDVFFQEFNLLFQQHFPVITKTVRTRNIVSPYISPDLKKYINEKNRLARLAKKWPLTYRETYRRYRNNLTKLLKSAKNEYYKNKLRNNQGNPKSHWDTINSILGRSKDHYSISLDPPIANISEAFNDHFMNLSILQGNSLNTDYKRYLTSSPNYSMYMLPTNVSEIRKCLQAMKSNTPGFDDISPKILRHVSESLAVPLAYTINLSLKHGIFPDHLKKAKVIPIYKAGNRCDINNYRPISILSAFSKIYEKIIANRLINYLEKNNLLIKNQHGFRASHSTESAVLHFVNNVYKYLEEKYYVVGVFVDLSKAFDSLNHKILLDKLQHIGIRGLPLQLFTSYLQNRSQYVQCNNTSSKSLKITKGVPQGSVLGPILFIIYMNDIINASSRFKFTMYADDTNLLIADKDITSLHLHFSSELKSVSQWLKSNELKLNVKKTNYIFFQNRSLKNYLPPVQLEGESLTQVSHTKFLGVRIDENLNWKFHIDDVCLKLSKLCGVLYKIRNNLTAESLLSIYYTLCYPHLIYCVSIWASTWPSFLVKLTVAQNKIIRCLFLLKKFESVTDIMSSMNILRFNSIHKYFSLLLIYKMFHSGVEIFKVINFSRDTRSNNVDFVCPQFRTVLFKNSVLCTAPKLFNSLPLQLKQLLQTNSYSIFKRKIRNQIS